MKGVCVMLVVKELLQEKGSDFWTIAPERSLGDALELMADKEIGALVVVEGTKPVGMFSERDFARGVIRIHHCTLDTLVKKLMSSPLIVVGLMTSLDECMSLMTGKRVRHLPVVEGGQLVGVVSMRDLVAALVNNREKTIQKLENYIAGTDYVR